MSNLEIGNMVRVKDSYYATYLVGKIGKVVSYLAGCELVTVQFEGMEGHPELHDGNWRSDSNLDRKSNKRYISPKNLELVEKENKQMTMQDLKSGMTVRTRNGVVYLVVNEGISRESGYEPFIKYNDDLTHERFESLDIVEVYLFSTSMYGNTVSLESFLDLEQKSMKLLWKRQELPKLSSAERVILENLDKQYKWIARDKNEELYIYYRRPDKDTSCWYITASMLVLEAFPNIFKFVKWEDEQPHNIEELLKGE